jgi:hypothetical protein
MLFAPTLASVLAACSVPLATPPGPTGSGGGAVYVTESANGGGGFNYDAVALFPDVLQYDELCARAPVQAGSCCYYPPDAGFVSSAAQRSAGTVQFGDVNSTALLATLSYSTSGYPDAPWTPGPSWGPGVDTLVAYAPGDAIPGFLVETLAPAYIDGLTPAWTSPLLIPRRSDFTLSWTPADAGVLPDAPPQLMWLAMMVTDSSGQSPHGYLFCEAPDGQGTLTAPSALLQHFSMGDVCQECYVARESLGVDAGYSLHVRTSVAGSATYMATFQ